MKKKTKLKRWIVYGVITGNIYLGEYEAETKEGAEIMAEDEASVSFCHQCAKKCEDPMVTEAIAEEITERK